METDKLNELIKQFEQYKRDLDDDRVDERNREGRINKYNKECNAVLGLILFGFYYYLSK